MSDQLRRTQLFAWHQSHGARMGGFAGWDMPLYYETGAVAEHHLVRRSVGLFDISHMGRFIVHGADAPRLLDGLVSSSIADISTNSSRYGLLCRDDGSVIDDVFVYRIGPGVPGSESSPVLAEAHATGAGADSEVWLVVVNAGNRDRDLEWIESHASSFAVTVSNQSDALSMVAVQGPQAIALLDIASNGDVSAIPRFGAAYRSVAGITCLVGRTGYTGEDGAELYFGAQDVENLWTRLLEIALDSGIDCGPIGLAARDSLRFEPGFALYGHEIDDATTPVEAGLKWACDLSKPFIGRDAIQAELDGGLRKRLVTLRMVEPGVPREGFPVLAVGGPKVGVVVSGMFAPTADGYFANGYVDPGYAKNGTELDVEIRGRARRAIVVKRPIYTPAYR